MYPPTMHPSVYSAVAHTPTCYACGEEIRLGCRACVRCAMKELPKIQIETVRKVDRCTTCLRYSVPPSGWTILEYEENEMLRYLLKKIPELAKYKLEKAEFVHSEEHSKRLRMTLHINRTEELAEQGAYEPVVETVSIVWTIKGKHCLDCARIASKQTWSSVVQLRQRSESKATLLWLEQAILRAGLHNETTDIKGVPHGIDFFYKHKTPALRLVRFVEAQVVAHSKDSEQLVKMDKQSSDSRYKFAYSVEIPSINRHDLIYLPEALAKAYSLSQLCTVLKVSRLISLVDVRGALKDINKIEYFKHIKQIRVLRTQKHLVPFEVVESERTKPKGGAGTGENVLVYGNNSTQTVTVLKGDGTFESTQTFLTGLKEEDKVLGYDLSSFYTDLEIQPGVVLIKKEVAINENWKIKRLTQGSSSPTDPTDFRLLVEEIKQNPQMLRTVDLYDEYDKLIKNFSAIQVSEEQAQE
ncbi:60S ribosomal export protein NMD3 [Nematocida sp. AWRm77]|nr:60S ribosomal export protein NMD3 [Nematocida sp. AWRm77]